MNNNTKEEWIIFFERNGIRYYLHRVYDRIGRVNFCTSKYAIFESVIEVNDVVQKITDIFNIYYPNEKLKVGLCDLKK